MNLIATFFHWIFGPGQIDVHDGDERYLAEAADICDLERRMRVLDQRRPFGPFGQNV